MDAKKNSTFKAPDRRYRIMKVSPELFLDMAFNRSQATELDDGNVSIRTISHEGMPEGTQIEAVCFDDYERCFMFRFWNATWDEVEECARIPEANVQFRARDYVFVPRNGSSDPVLHDAYEAKDSKINFREFL